MALPSRERLKQLIARSNGVLKLRPEFVQRFYRDSNRLGQSSLKTHRSQNMPERWIGSSIAAINPPPLPPGGLSMLANAPEVSLRDAIRAAPREMIGDELYKKHGAEFRVLVKLLDPGEPIPFHLHATDAQVKRLRKHFRGHRFGKDEAYYFLDAPKGPLPYTHIGLHTGVSKRELIDAVKKGRDHALELSPVIYQEYEHGFFLPAGVPHSPGTALTLEIQQPSDVYTLLETHAAGKAMSPQQIHPGFKSLDEAFQLINMKLSQRVGELDPFQLSPRVISKTRGGEIAWIFPPDVCRKFAGKRIRVKTSLTLRESAPASLLIWKGRGILNGRAIRGGDEFFLTRDALQNGIDLAAHVNHRIEAFIFSVDFPTAVK